MHEPQLVIMAAGIGNRYGGLKQVDPVGPCGEIIIDYSIYDALQAGFKKIIFIIRKEIEDTFRQKIGHVFEKKADISYVYQELDSYLPQGFCLPDARIKPWGTGHAILCAKNIIDSPSAVINADDLYGRNSFKTLYNYLKTLKDDTSFNYCMVGFILENTLTEYGYVARGICAVDDDTFLSGIVERTKIKKFGNETKYEDNGKWIKIPENSIVSMNMWGFTPSYYIELERRFEDFLRKNIDNPKAEYFAPTIVNELLKERKAKVKILNTKDRWFGVTYPQDKVFVKEVVKRLIDKGVYPEDLWGKN